MGHYSGLIHLGRESANSKKIPVYAMPRMAKFLRNNGPWSQLIDLQNILIQPLQNKFPVSVSPHLTITPLVVPHRDEFSETVGFMIRGKSKCALYIPDIDKWDLWETDINELLTKVDYAFLDATFFQDGEISRPMSEVPHPFVEESIKRFKSLPIEEKNKIYFIHLNHTNPARDAEFKGRLAVEDKGYHFATFGMRFSLD
jgi:pyrroloquinoline quinone biosynthesis protein B